MLSEIRQQRRIQLLTAMSGDSGPSFEANQLAQRIFPIVGEIGMLRLQLVLTLALFILATTTAEGTVTQYTNKASWEVTIGYNFSSIGFTGYPNNTFITNQYQDLGIIFTDGNDSIHLSSSFITDGAGFDGNNVIHMSFTTPMKWIGVDFPGQIVIQLVNQGSVFFTSMFFDDQGTLAGFAGLTSSTTFDGAVIFDPTGGDAQIDNLHFGPQIPAPGALGLIGLAGMCGRKRRRQ